MTKIMGLHAKWTQRQRSVAARRTGCVHRSLTVAAPPRNGAATVRERWSETSEIIRSKNQELAMRATVETLNAIVRAEVGWL